MELQIQDLVSSIRKEGVEAASKEAEQILEAAKKKADELTAAAKAEAAQIRETAKKEAEILKQSIESSSGQAQRDAMLSFKAQVQKEFEKLLAADVKKSLSDETLAKLMLAAVEGEEVSQYAAEVAEVTDVLRQQLAEKIRDGLEIRVSREVSSGFRLAAKNGSGYFDCSDEEIMKMLKPYFRNLNF